MWYTGSLVSIGIKESLWKNTIHQGPFTDRFCSWDFWTLPAINIKRCKFFEKVHHLFVLILPTRYSDHTCWCVHIRCTFSDMHLQRGQTLLKYHVRSIPDLWINPFTIFLQPSSSWMGVQVTGFRGSLKRTAALPCNPIFTATCTEQCSPAYSANCATSLYYTPLHTNLCIFSWLVLTIFNY